MTGVKINHKTVQRWATGYAGLMDRYLDMIIAQVGEKWRTDETCIMIRGDCKYLFAMLGNDTGYWLAKMVAEHKGNDDVEPLSGSPKGLRARFPRRWCQTGALTSDMPTGSSARPRTSCTRTRARAAHPHGGRHEQQSDRILQRKRDAPSREGREVLKNEDFAVLTALRLYHNHVRPYLALPDNITPGEVVGSQHERNSLHQGRLACTAASAGAS